LLCLCFLVPLTLTGCQEKPAVDHNEVVAVMADGKGNITVEAVLTKGFLDSYTEKMVYLFEIPASYAADMDLAELDPVAELRPKAEMSFKIPALDGARSRLYSSYLVASYDSATRSYTALTYPRSVTNFSGMTKATGGVTAERSIKGLISDHPADAIRLGIAHTVVDVHMETLILDGWQEGAVAYVWNGTTAYLNGDGLDKLDEAVKAYTSAGINVYLRFLLGERTEHTPMALYFPSDASANTRAPEIYAVNMAQPETAERMEGFFDFMADRYAAPEDGSLPVTSFILGYRVNHAAVYGFAGNPSLDEYVSNYEKLVRVANTAIKSHAADGRVYVSLDSARMIREQTGHWDISAFLSAFNSACLSGGNYDWYPACELYADSTSVWVADSNRDATYYTVHSLGTLTDLLAGDIYRTPDGEERKLLISGMSIPAVPVGGTASHESDLCQAASYAYTYMTCVQNGSVEALIYDTYADADTVADTQGLCGIWKKASTVCEDTADTGASDETEGAEIETAEPSLPAPDGELVISEKRPLYDTFKLIDTTEAASLADGLTALIGEPYTKLERLLAGGTQPVTAVRGSAELIDYSSTHGKALPLYTFNEGTLHGFRDAGDLTYLELRSAETLNSVTLYARFDREAVCDPMGVSVTVPATKLMGGEDLIFDLYAGSISDPGVSSSNSTRERPTVTLRLTRDAKGLASEGDGALLYEASVPGVKDGVWQTAVFDVEAFTSILEYEDEVTLTLLMDYGTDGELYEINHLGLAGIYITGDTAASQTSPWLVIAIVAVLAVLVVGVFVFLLIRHKRRH
ncbi:MAG: hypothetical protein IJX72_04855, partial [Clostridia bacterium]|nr:hypothetical protein [Clostridia bacterium]